MKPSLHRSLAYSPTVTLTTRDRRPGDAFIASLQPSEQLDSLLVEVIYVSLLVLVALSIAVVASLAAYRLARGQV